jgi:hypothetical protein
MAVTATLVKSPTGARIFPDGVQSKVKYIVAGDGVGGALDLPYGRLRKLRTVEGLPGYTWVDVPASRKITVTVPATLTAAQPLNVSLVGEGS